MRRTVFVIATALAVSLAAVSALAQKATPKSAPGAKGAAKTETKSEAAAAKAAPRTPATGAPSATGASREADEKAIRQLAEQFATAYNAHDAKAIAALFGVDAEVVNEDGLATQGRAGIEEVFADIFEQTPKSKIKVDINSIRFVGPGVAVEDGVTSTVSEPGKGTERSRYTVVHVRQEGKWMMASARDVSDETGDENLGQLGWLVGEWIDESPDGTIITNTRWSDNHRFLLSEFTMQVGGRPAMNGTQRIAWDPLAKVIRSWVFDSEGGFVEGVYSRDGDQWTVKLAGVTRDGQPASATNVLTRLSDQRMSWQSRDRSVGGEIQPDVDEIIVVKKPPKPM